MAIELVASTSQLRLTPLYAQRSEQVRSGIAGELLQVPARG